MFSSEQFRQDNEDTFSLEIPADRDYRILQLTDLHLGYGIFSGRKDRMAQDAVRTIIKKARPDLIVLTGDSIFPFFPKSGTMNNRREAERFIKFMDGFEVPYTMVFGNHDCEMGAVCSVLGIKPEQSVETFLGGLPGRYREPEKSPGKMQGAIFTLDDATGLCVGVERIDVR